MKFIDKFLARWGYAKEVVKDFENEPPVRDAKVSSKLGLGRPIFLKFKTTLNSRNIDLLDQEYDFKSIRRAIDVEPMLRQAKEKYLQLIWKGGYSFVGKNQKAVDYVKMRFSQISLVTGMPTPILLDQISEEMITYHNVFVIMQRDANLSGGKPYMNIFGKRVNPISGMFIVPASHMEPLVDQKTAMVVGWKCCAIKDNEDDMYFLKDDVIHMYMSRAVGNITGTPAMIPVLGDVRALRRIEESAEALVFQHSFPLIQYQVGTKDSPEADPFRFDEIKIQIENSSPQGMFVVPADHNIVAIGNGSSPIDVHKYLEYFRLRIISGLGLSTVAFGDSGTSNRGTAQVQDKGLQDGAKMYVGTVKTFFNEKVINEFLREGGFDLMNPEDTVKLYTPEIDIDAKIKDEVHAMGLFHGNAITETEMRHDLGLDPITDEQRAGMYWTLIDLPKSIILARDESFAQYATSGLKVDKGTATKMRPTNQSGVKVGSKPPVNKSSQLLEGLVSMSLGQVTSNFINRIMGNLIEELPKATKTTDYQEHFRKEMEEVYLATFPILKEIFAQGWSSKDSTGKDPDITSLYGNLKSYREFLHELGNDATILLEGLQSTKITKVGEGYVNSITSGDVVNIFDAVRHRLSAGTKPIIESAFKLGESLAVPVEQDKGE